MIFSGVTGITIPRPLGEIQATTTPTVEVQKTENSKENTNRAMNVEAYVRNYFENTPIMAEVARCESHFRQYDRNGDVIRGRVNSSDVGVMQINETYHLDRSEKLGIDIYTTEGNLAYAKFLYEEQGVRPWLSSANCWTVGQVAIK